MSDERTQEDLADGRFADQEQAEAHLKVVQAALPAAEPAYVPSGKMPPVALLFMVIGGLAGAVGGAVVSAVLGGVWALLVMMFGGIGDAFWESGWIAYLPYTLMGIIGILGYFCLYASAGVAAGACVVFAGRFGRNRNVLVPKLIAAVSAAAAAAVCQFTLMRTWLPFMYDSAADSSASSMADALGSMSGGSAWILWTVSGIGAGVALLVATGLAGAKVKADRFSEQHGRFMKRRSLPSLSFEGAAALAAAIQAADTGAVADALGRTGERAELSFFALPDGQEGFLDLRYHFKATYEQPPEAPAEAEETEANGTAEGEVPTEAAERADAEEGRPGEDTLEESWLAGSWHLDAARTGALLRVAEQTEKKK
jgi:hypothetical protein